MAEVHALVLDAMLKELVAQGHAGTTVGEVSLLTAYPVRGRLDVVALARAVEAAIGEKHSEDGVPTGHLNATNDG